MRRLTPNDGGFTLLELVVSILIFSLGFLGVTKMQQYAIMGNSFSMQMSNTINIIDNQEEYLRGLNIGDPDLTLGNHNGGSVTRQGIQYDLSWTVSTTGLGPAVNARDIDIQVAWVEKTVNHRVAMKMFRSN
ncbi:MAG TPA: prepilin-type N-terminal cleavage/methylation domain-containing protein [Deltaproteobacteria bacterium]|mgnify:FL=1|jgi:prepilin-type N-terminal cleavage/methylation domain-containing protein|nr:prepilin-type N-terminal cleavage/methylation domain-containing protein [Deltaproteobacteria bacterium]HQJ07730.1 prepilin-type N-terminal cleavage/methylation domain-containing protein [Deltaproteobacteria bacterium]